DGGGGGGGGRGGGAGGGGGGPGVETAGTMGRPPAGGPRARAATARGTGHPAPLAACFPPSPPARPKRRGLTPHPTASTATVRPRSKGAGGRRLTAARHARRAAVPRPAPATGAACACRHLPAWH